MDANGNVTGNMTGDVTISADSDLGVTSVLVAGGVSSNRKSNGISVSGDGVIKVFVSSNTTGAQIGNGTAIKTNGDIFVLAAASLKYTGITGGIAAGSGHGVGASVSVIVVNTKTAAAHRKQCSDYSKESCGFRNRKRKDHSYHRERRGSRLQWFCCSSQSGSQRDPDQYPGRCWNRNLQSDRKHEGNRR